MKKTTTIITTITTARKALFLVLFAAFFAIKGFGQCTAAFTYTIGSGGVVNFSNASVGTSTNTAYYWSWSGNSGYGSSSQASPTFTFNYNGTYYVSLMIIDSLANCWNSVTDTVVITNSQPCQVSFTYTYTSNTQIDITNTSVGNVAYDIDWGDGNWSNGNLPGSNAFHNYTYNGNYTITLWSDTTGGYCGGYQSVVVTIVGANPCPVAAAYVVTNNGNGSFTFTDTVTTNPGLTVHWWYVNGSLVAYGNPVTYNFNQNGTFTVCDVAIDSLSFGGGSCSDTACSSVTVSNVTCNDSAWFQLYPDSNMVGNGVWYAYLYSWNWNYPSSAVWNWGDGTTSSGLFPSHTYTAGGWYTICMTAYWPCGDSSTYCSLDSIYKMAGSMVTVNVVDGINGIKANNDMMTTLSAYPNPFSEELTISFTSYESKEMTCSMFDMLGNVVMKQEVQVSKGDNEIHLNTPEIGKGVYFINLSSAGGKASTIKVVK